MQTFECISKRVSVREYLSKAVGKELLLRLVEAGKRAPTARGQEPWEFIIVTQPDMLSKLGVICDHGSFIKNAAACIVVVCRDTKYFLEDGCAATMNILLAAADLNLGACWVAGDKKEYQVEVLNILNVPGEFKLVSLVSLGWPKIQLEQNKKRSLKEVAHWEKF